MTSDLLTSLQLDKTFDSSRIIVVKELNGCDSSFITSCVLGHCVKNKNAVFVISAHHSLQHYHNVGLKMNYNLQKSVDSGIINFYDVGEVITNSILDNKCLTSQEIWLKIKEILLEMHKKFNSVNVIFDGVSHLFDLQLNIRQVNEICKELIDLIRSLSNSYLILQCNVACDDDITYVLANLLSHKANTLAEVESLSSGLSADVSGHLNIKYLSNKYENEHRYIFEPRSAQYLFKLFDRGVKLLAPGTV
ncbi:uncharacterized protein Elp6 [Vanessa tameamea]|uniref:Elongator complex protein 6 n=1 Tax=Vanessa tameamea TaxID=334116 RepID=A0A8B8HUN0_VANTA|nr:uncharacterized protein LOC113395047 [Vanessa tameamea]